MKYGEGEFFPEVLEHNESSHLSMYNTIHIAFQQKTSGQS